MDKESKKSRLHPVWFFILLIIITIILSAILSLFNFQGTQTDISLGSSSTSVLTVESLISEDGIKFIISECVNNFLKFAPLGSLIVGLIGVGLMIKVGLLKSIFSKCTKFIPRKTMFFIFSLLCIVMGFSSDLAFVIMIPIAAILFTEYKRSQVIGMTMAFASVAAGSNINLFITSIDYSLIELAKPAVNLIDPNYTYGYTGNLFFIVISSLLLALLITIITDILSKTRPVRIGNDESEISEKLDKKGLKRVFITLGILIVIFVYSIIPNLPLSGFLLDSKQTLYVNKLFSANAPFVNGILYIVSFAFVLCAIVYGITTKQIKNEKDVIKYLSNSLNGLGEMLLLLFVASQFISLFKYTNIGNVITVNIFNLIESSGVSFVVLILLAFLGIAISNIFVTSISTKWTLFVPGLIPLFMKSNITPEFTGAIFRVASSVTNLISPVLPYFVIFIGFIGLYSKSDFNIKKCYKLIMPYFISIAILWLFIIFSFYVLKAPIGPGVYPTI
ncbi:MAG: AbgT family transporter [Bacilli bacterium]|nr:AbgT family transporter [Bacilli bacterium]MBP3635571.1 AbgT family transporter [Bacilli bacterium]